MSSNNQKESPTTELHLTLTVSEINLILEALGNLAYARVYEVVDKIKEQSYNQLNRSNHRFPEEEETSNDG